MKLIKHLKPYWPLFILPVWILVYIHLEKLTLWLAFSLSGAERGNHLAESVWFFIYEYPKVMLLLTLIIFIMGIIRSWFGAERTRKALGGRKTLSGNVMAAGLGVVTPFCSCSAIPLFLGFVEAGVPLGITFSFLIAAPMINEVALVMLYGMFGWKVALLYASTGLVIAITAGWIIGRLKLTRWVEPWVYEVKMGNAGEKVNGNGFSTRISYGIQAVKDIIRKVWLYVALGIGIGAAAHGYVPEEFMAGIMGRDAWYAVPLSVLLGIPLYSNAAGIVPIVSVLLEKGASLGTSLAFMMAVIGLSLPEMIILRKVLKIPLILTFIGIVATGIMIVGYLFNWVFG